LTKEDALSSIESSLFYEKVMKHVIAAAEVTDLEVTAEEEAEYDQKANLPVEVDSADEPPADAADAAGEATTATAKEGEAAE